MDSTIERAEGKLAKAKSVLQFAETRLSEAKKRIVQSDLSVKGRFSLEAAQRAIEIEALKERVAQYEKELEHAKADEPRRAEERKKAGELNAKADALDSKVASLSKQSQQIELEASNLRAEASRANEKAGASTQELSRQVSQREAALQKSRQESREYWTRELNVATRELAEAKRSKDPLWIEEKSKALKHAEKNLEALKNV